MLELNTTAPITISNETIQLVKQLEESKLMLESEIHLHKMVLKNSAEIIMIMTSFYYLSFKEICETGFNLCRLETVQGVLSE